MARLRLLFALFLISIWRGLDMFGGNGLINVIVAIGLISWIDICRLTRAQLLTLSDHRALVVDVSDDQAPSSAGR